MRKYSKKRELELLEKYGVPIGYRDNIPIFKAIMRNDSSGHIRIFCPYCKHWHLHGFIKSLGHRIAHCGDQRIPYSNEFQRASDSPFRKTGYYILLVDGQEKD